MTIHSKVQLISVTPDAEKTMAYVARVSNPSNQDNENYAGLLRYCIKHNHWSVFEQSHMTLEIETTRGIAAQVLRHRSFTFQEFSQRGVAKECARFVLPLATPTRIYMTGSCRSWIHYIDLRSAHGTQKEHMIIAEQCREIFKEQFPAVAEAMEW